MILDSRVTVRSAEDGDRNQLSNIIHFEAHVHRHLDWRAPLDWIGFNPFVVAIQNNKIIATLACPPDPPGVAWVRVFVSGGNRSYEELWDLLWENAKPQLLNKNTNSIAAIPLQKWFRELLQDKGFEYIHNVIVFAWDNIHKDLPQPEPIKIRNIYEEELPIIQEIDEEAFGPIWRNSLDSIILAYKQARLATVAEDQSGLVGYQISTSTPYGAHLARLAVRPCAQEKGIGYALTRHLQDQLNGPKPLRISVNTQDNNNASIALYKKAGFQKINEVYPVFRYEFGD
ncbi:MAG: GNAT family N-acetyltransferase [Anaerolineales bacterium]|jgi:ribosomal protein S18 acetylase RimI-like enzyme